jgi:hypothetical protein
LGMSACGGSAARADNAEKDSQITRVRARAPWQSGTFQAF